MIAIGLLALFAMCMVAIKIDCDNTEIVNEEHIHYCCKHPDGHNEVFDECAKQTGFNWPNKNEEAIEDITADQAIANPCFGKCVFENLQFMNIIELDMASVKQYYNKTYGDDPEYVKEMTNAFDHCHGKAEEYTAIFLLSSGFNDDKQKVCRMESSVIWACVVREFFCNCPGDRWSNTEECNNVFIQQSVQECFDFALDEFKFENAKEITTYNY